MPPGGTPSIRDKGSPFVVAVSGTDEDHFNLMRIFREGPWTAYTRTRLRLCVCRSVDAAKDLLRASRVCVVLLDTDVPDGTWQDMAAYLSNDPINPSLIVSSRLADEWLWAEALNLGAFDVLAKPFRTAEVVRAVALAWLHWRDRQTLRFTAPRNLQVGGPTVQMQKAAAAD